MESFRFLQPAPIVRSIDTGRSVEAPGPHLPELSRHRTQARHRHTDEEWDRIKADLTGLLYTHELKDAAEIIKETRKFDAGLRSYKSKIAQWGLKQHIKADHLKVIVAKKEKRKLDDAKDTVFIVKGIQLEAERLELFKRRAKDKQSPSAATPQSIEYYTPRGTGLTPNSHKSPPGWSPLNRQPIFHHILQAGRMQEDFCSHIMIYDKDAEPVAIVEVTVKRRTICEEDEGPPKHDLHQGGIVAVIGRGRFSKRQKASQLLWQASNMAMLLQSTIRGQQPAENPRILVGDVADITGVTYFSSSRPADFGLSNLQRILSFIKHDSLLQNILGLTKQDRGRWVGDWLRMVESETPLVESVANNLFGNTLLSYPDMDILNIVIKFYNSSPSAKPILIRVSIGQDPRLEIRNCQRCSQTFQIFDFIGPEGAAKLHLPSDDPTMHHTFRNWAEFCEMHTTKRKVVHTRWSQIAYYPQGWSKSPLLKRCPCDNEVHKNRASEHYINVFDEKVCEDDEFDAMADSYQMPSFEPFPQERKQCIVIVRRWSREDSDEEKWDSQGDEGSENEAEFEPFPPEEHSTVCLSQPIQL